MDYDPEADRQRREIFLSVLLALLGGSAILFFLVLITMGFFLWFLLGLAILAGVAALHYLTWGWAFSGRTAGEREEAEAQAQLELNDWDLPDPRRPRHY